VDLHAGKVEAVNRRKLHQRRTGEHVKRLVDSGCLQATTDFSVLREIDAVSICRAHPAA
jgi:UDP-N-acetyl-D-mannosaminuronate dehydrogenase